MSSVNQQEPTSTKMKNVIYFLIGLAILIAYTLLNVSRLMKWSLIDGKKPMFDVQHKLANGGVVVNNGMTGTTEIL